MQMRDALAALINRAEDAFAAADRLLTRTNAGAAARGGSSTTR